MTYGRLTTSLLKPVDALDWYGIEKIGRVCGNKDLTTTLRVGQKLFGKYSHQLWIQLVLRLFNAEDRKRLWILKKNQVLKKLENATHNTRKGTYSKGAQSFDILGTLGPRQVEKALPHAKALLEALRGGRTG